MAARMFLVPSGVFRIFYHRSDAGHRWLGFTPPVASDPSIVAPFEQPEAVPEPTTEAKSSTNLGRGGAQHKAIQERIKDEAEKLGYRVIRFSNMMLLSHPEDVLAGILQVLNE